MLKKRARVVTLSIYLIDIVLTTASFYVAYFIRDFLYSRYGYERLFPLGYYHWLLLVIIPLWTALFFYTGTYRFSYAKSPLRELVRLWVSVLTGVICVGTVVFLSRSLYFSRLFLATFAATNIVLLTLGRFAVYLAARSGRKSPQNRRNIVIVGTGEDARRLARTIEKHSNWGLNLIGYVTDNGHKTEADHKGRMKVLGSIREIQSIVEKHCVDEVIFAVSRERVEELEDVFLLLEDLGINARLVLNIFPHMISKVHLDELDNIPLLTFTTIPTNEFALLVKRVIDVFVSAVLLILFSPLIAGIAVAIKLTSPGPVIFTQRRCGLNGRVFDFYKFRSMYIDAEKRADELRESNEVDGPVFKMKRDPRVTPVGRFLRRTSLDELPQLWNVLKGDMSIVGPRPPLPEEVEKYERWQRRRLSMKPGITCIWQVSGRSRIGFQEWMKLDLQYIDNWSIWLDLKIIFKTIPAVLSGRGAY